MSTNVRWIADLSQKNSLLALVVSLLIGIMFTAGGMTLLYSDNKTNTTRGDAKYDSCHVENIALHKEIDALNAKLVTMTIDYYSKGKREDSSSIAKLNKLKTDLEEKVRQQEEVNRLQKINIEKRDQAIKTNNMVKKQNEKKIKALKNDINK